MTAPLSLRHAVLAAAALAWAASFAHLWRTEVLRERPSDDVQALVDAARLRAQHAAATYAVRWGRSEVGRLRSTVSGGQREEQLLYRLEGELEQPVALQLSGFVLAGWDRRPERFVIEALLAGERHRVEGRLERAPEGVHLQARYVPPASGRERSGDLVLPEAPVLAPGPLPLPELPELASGGRAGTILDPITQQPTDWTITSTAAGALEVAARARAAVRHDVRYGSWTAVAWTEPTGFPLRIELPLELTVELVEERR